MFIVKMADHDGNHRYLVEKNVPEGDIAFNDDLNLQPKANIWP